MFLLGFFDIRLSKTRKIRNSPKISGKSISDPFLASKTDPVFPFWAPFSVSWPQKKRKNPDISGHNAGTNSGKLGFYRFYCFRGRSWHPRGRFRSLRGSISEAPGPDFGAILHKPGQKVRKVRIPENGRDFPWFYDEIPPFSLL